MKKSGLSRLSVVVLFAAFCAAAVICAAPAGYAKDKETYVGSIIGYKFGMLQLEHNNPAIAKKVLYLPVDSKTVVLSGKKSVDLAEVWQKTKKVKVAVLLGKVQRIDILEWK